MIINEYEIKPRADLGGANLGGANLSRADLGSNWIIQGPMRSDGYYFFLQQFEEEKEPMIKAGCRYFTIESALKHWNDTREGKLLDETMAIINGMIALAKAQGRMK